MNYYELLPELSHCGEKKRLDHEKIERVPRKVQVAKEMLRVLDAWPSRQFTVETSFPIANAITFEPRDFLFMC